MVLGMEKKIRSNDQRSTTAKALACIKDLGNQPGPAREKIKDVQQQQREGPAREDTKDAKQRREGPAREEIKDAHICKPAYKKTERTDIKGSIRPATPTIIRK